MFRISYGLQWRHGEPVAPTGFWYSDPESGSQLPPVAAEFVAWLEQVMPLCPPVPLDQRSLGDRGDRMLLVHSSHMNFRFRRVDSIPDDLLWEPSWDGSGPLVDINQNPPLMKIAVRNGCSQCVALVEEILLELGVEEASVFEETCRALIGRSSLETFP